MTLFNPEADAASVAEAKNELPGILTHEVQSPFQGEGIRIHVMLPDGLSDDRKYDTLYVLPVETFDGQAWGDALGQIREHDLHNRHQLICVTPTFSHTPWYADHPTDPRIRQESHFLNVVLPFVDRTYPVNPDPASRLLLGFSKSGWGAFSLLLRHPQSFGKAAAWDAPFG